MMAGHGFFFSKGWVGQGRVEKSLKINDRSKYCLLAHPVQVTVVRPREVWSETTVPTASTAREEGGGQRPGTSTVPAGQQGQAASHTRPPMHFLVDSTSTWRGGGKATDDCAHAQY